MKAEQTLGYFGMRPYRGTPENTSELPPGPDIKKILSLSHLQPIISQYDHEPLTQGYLVILP